MGPIRGLGDKIICQICIVTDDAETFARRYAEIFGIDLPEPHLTLGHDVTEATYRGKPTDARARVYYWTFGQVDFEVLQPLGQGSFWQEWLDSHGPSVHHIAFRVKDTEGVVKEFARFGYEMVQQGFFSDVLPGGGHSGIYSYLDTAKGLGTAIELLQDFSPEEAQ